MWSTCACVRHPELSGVLMKNGVELSVSRSKYAAVRAAYLEWKGQFGDE